MQVGTNALYNNITGSSNTAFGNNALQYHLVDNTVAIGTNALQNNVNGSRNTR